MNKYIDDLEEKQKKFSKAIEKATQEFIDENNKIIEEQRRLVEQSLL